MFLLRLILGLLALPLLLVAYVLRFIFIIFTGFGKIIAEILAGICVIGGIVLLIESDPDWFWALILGAVLSVLPFIGVFIINVLDYFIAWVRAIAYGD